MFHPDDTRRVESSCYYLLHFQSQGVEAKCKENEEETESWTRDEKKDEGEEEEEERDDGGDSTTNLLLQIAGTDLSVVTCLSSHSQWFRSLDDCK
jgi:hypothetical protein